jgi:hypothetical protein
MPATRADTLQKMSARSALITALLLAFGLAGITANQPGNWLVLLFKLLAGFEGINSDMLYRLNGMDIILLALEGVVMSGLGAALWKTSRIGSLAAAILPFAGIVLYLVTASAGRSAFMGAILIISLVMLGSGFPRWTAFLGILSSVLLLAGDMSLSAAPSILLAGGFAAGYIGSIAWLCAVAIPLLRLDKKPPPGPESGPA